MYRYKYRLMR
jgi:pre-mRNA-processing factor 8